MANCKMYYIDDMGAGVNIPRVSVVRPRLMNTPDGGKFVVFDLAGEEPNRGDGQMIFTMDAWFELLDEANKVATKLVSVEGSKKK